MEAFPEFLLHEIPGARPGEWLGGAWFGVMSTLLRVDWEEMPVYSNGCFFGLNQVKLTRPFSFLHAFQWEQLIGGKGHWFEPKVPTFFFLCFFFTKADKKHILNPLTEKGALKFGSKRLFLLFKLFEWKPL